MRVTNSWATTHTSPLRERNKKLLQGEGKETTSARYKRKGKDTNNQVGQETIKGSKAGSKLWTLAQPLRERE